MYNVKYTYIYKNDPLMGILPATEFSIHSTTNSLKDYTPGQKISGFDVILTINCNAYLELTRQTN